MIIPVALFALAVGVTMAGLRRYLSIVTVTGTSMEPTYCSGDRLLARRPGRRGIRRGDVIVLRDDRPLSTLRPGALVPPPSGRLIKRVTAVPGDPIPRHSLPESAGAQDSVVPPKRFVVLGDNPSVSADSRVYGYIPEDHIVGVILRQFSRPHRYEKRTPNRRCQGVSTARAE